MGFFKDFKRDFAQAVDELLPDTGDRAGDADRAEDSDKTADKVSDAVGSSDISKGDATETETEAVLTDITMVEDEVSSNTAASSEESGTRHHDTSRDILISEAEKLKKKIDESILEKSRRASEEIDREIDGLEELSKDDDESEEASQEISQDDVRQSGKVKSRTGSNTDREETSMAEMEREIKTENEYMNLSEETTYITKGTVITGDIEVEGDIDIMGRVDGDVKCTGKLIVGGRINGNITTDDLYTNRAHTNGTITATGNVKLGAGTIAIGDISANTAVLAGAVKGNVDVRDTVVVDSTAVVVGNIKCRSIQINSGAILNGTCEQTYSDVDVRKYFTEEIEDISNAAPTTAPEGEVLPETAESTASGSNRKNKGKHK